MPVQFFWVGAGRSLGRSPDSFGVVSTFGSSQPESHVSRLPLSQQGVNKKASLTGQQFTKCLSQDHPSCSSIVSHALLWRRTPSTATFNGALHSWSLDP